MPIHTILHKGLRANDVLIEGDGYAILTYYTHNKQENITSSKVGLMLYKNEKFFTDKSKAMLWYMTYQYKRWIKVEE